MAYNEVDKDKPVKFNMDLAFLEMLHNIIKNSVEASIKRNEEARFRFLEAAGLMLKGVMKKERLERFNIQFKEMKDCIDKLREMENKYHIYFDNDENHYDFSYSANEMVRRQGIPREIFTEINKVHEILSKHETFLRDIILENGMYLTKIEGAGDAMDDED